MINGIKLLLLVLLLLTTFATACFAMGVRSQETYVLAGGETHDGDLLVSCRKVVIEGTVLGDVYAFAENLEINGKIIGDLITFSRNTKISGEVAGDIRAFTHQLTIDGHVSRNVTLFAQYFDLAQPGEIGGNILAFTETVDLAGRLGKEINGAISEVRITGEIGRGSTMLHVDKLHIEPSARINGDLHYTSPHEAAIAPGAQIAGEVSFHRAQPEPEEKPSYWPLFLTTASLISTLLIWLAIRYLFPQALFAIHRTLDEKRVSTLGVGLLLLLAAPMLILVLLVTLVGIPVAVTLAAVLGILLYVAKIFVGSWAGIRLVDRLQLPISPLLAELIGVLGVSLLSGLPFVGWLLAAAIWTLFLGAAAAAVRRTNRPVL